MYRIDYIRGGLDECYMVELAFPVIPFISVGPL